MNLILLTASLFRTGNSRVRRPPQISRVRRPPQISWRRPALHTARSVEPWELLLPCTFYENTDAELKPRLLHFTKGTVEVETPFSKREGSEGRRRWKLADFVRGGGSGGTAGTDGRRSVKTVDFTLGELRNFRRKREEYAIRNSPLEDPLDIRKFYDFNRVNKLKPDGTTDVTTDGRLALHLWQNNYASNVIKSELMGQKRLVTHRRDLSTISRGKEPRT